MMTYVIPQKMSNTGTIHDLASDCFDRDIRFRDGEVYAVVLAAYYGGKGYTVHRSEAATLAACRALQRMGYSHEIIDTVGRTYWANGDTLIQS